MIPNTHTSVRLGVDLIKASTVRAGNVAEMVYVVHHPATINGAKCRFILVTTSG